MNNFLIILTFSNSFALTYLGSTVKLYNDGGNSFFIAALVNFTLFIFFLIKKITNKKASLEAK